MKLKQEVIDAMVALEASDIPGCSCQVPNASPPCGYCTDPGHPAVLEAVESWESEVDWAAYWELMDRAGELLKAAGFRRIDDRYSYDNLDLRACVSCGWDEDANAPQWIARSLGGSTPWSQPFVDVEAAIAFAVVQSSLTQEPAFKGQLGVLEDVRIVRSS